jgi:hypothetical protein
LTHPAGERQIAFADVLSVRPAKFHAGRTIAIIAGVAAVALLIVVIYVGDQVSDGHGGSFKRGRSVPAILAAPMRKPTFPARVIVLLPVLALAAAGKAPVSSWDSVRMLTPGTQIRVAASNAKAVGGTLESVTETTLMILSGATGRQLFEKTQVTKVSIRKAGHRGRNILIGAGVGLAAGAAIGVAAGNCSTCKSNQSMLRYSIGGGVFWGALVGAVWRTGGWRTVYER